MRSAGGVRRDALELLVGYGLILGVIWTARPVQRVLYWAAVIAVGVFLWRGFESWGAMGFRRANLVRSSWVVGLAVVLAGGLVWLGEARGWVQGGHGAGWFVRAYWGYALWALVQQALLQEFFLGRVLRLLGGRRGLAVCVTAAVFALAHLPNPILAPMTLIWGAVACAVFLRYRNIWPLAVAHALLGVTLATTMPKPVVRNMRVGLGYLAYPKRHGTSAAPGVQAPAVR